MNIVRKYTYLRNKDGEKKGEKSSPFLFCLNVFARKKTGISKVFQNKFKNMYEKHHILFEYLRIFFT